MPTSLGQGLCLQETDRAVLIKLEDLGEERWIPKSCLHDDSEVYGLGKDEYEGEVFVKTWWAEKEGLI